jgi:hypothetical protein
MFRGLIKNVDKTTGIYLASANLYNIKNFQISVEGNTFNLCENWKIIVGFLK